ncbi:MAG: class I SAM-dependent methyltransferase [Opitutaceae bacterium]|nr:class I SAM-dependent methyltransferase [Cytophagales bacterium]
MDFISSILQQYCDDHSDPEPAVLREISRETHLKVLRSRMLSEHFQGRFLSFLSKILMPQRILEIGTYTGYSAICLAEGLAQGGKLITIDCNPELETFIKENIAKANMSEKIQFVLGDAQDVLPILTGGFDLVFIDADKINYSAYYGMIFGKVRLGGLIVVDNVLWSGKVVEDVKSNDFDAIAIKEFNNVISKDPRVEKILLPIRDGIFLVRKIKEA